MAIQRRCLVSGCGCGGYARNMETYDPETEEHPLDPEWNEVKLYCARCGHPEERHELAASDS
jgi:hypothetical protein